MSSTVGILTAVAMASGLACAQGQGLAADDPQPGWAIEPGSGLSSGQAAGVNSDRLPLSEIRLPPGFSISLVSEVVPKARGMVLSKSGTLYVGSRGAGNVYGVRDHDGDGYAEDVRVLASGFDDPVGVDLHAGDLYFSSYRYIYRLPGIEARLDDSPRARLVTNAYPEDKWHGWKFIRIGPDGMLYVPQGVPCNVCEVDDPFGTITRINLDGSGMEIIARGIRNSVGFDWHPTTGELWFTDNGADMLGNDVPGDELNRITHDGQHFGFPYIHQGNVPDPQFGAGHDQADYAAPVQVLGPHAAALGMRFYTGTAFPQRYHRQVFIAEHGSWNRDDPLGARVTVVLINELGESLGYEVFAEGWQRADGSRWGRPADVLVAPDGSLLVSDDLAGAIYRISYIGE